MPPMRNIKKPPKDSLVLSFRNRVRLPHTIKSTSGQKISSIKRMGVRV